MNGGTLVIKIAGIDVGNDSVKLVIDGASEPIVVPSILSPGYERHIFQDEDSPLKALDVRVYSPKLKKNNQRYFVGLLAMEDQDISELEETDNKATSDQALIVALTALAYAGLTSQTYEPVEGQTTQAVEYIVGTGLPVRTYAGFHKTFEERLVGEHEVTFLSTPKLRGRSIRVIIKRAVVSIEGAAALFHMATHDNLTVKNEELYYGCIGICEMGALTTDFPVIKRMSIDNQFSTGEQFGLAGYLDNIIRDVEDQFGHRFPSRTKLIQRIKNRDYTIQRIGEGQADIRPIVDNYFNRAANKVLDLILKRWKKNPDIQCFYVLGGGASALREYINEEAGSVRLRFVNDSEFQNVYGYLKLAKNKTNQSIAAAATAVAATTEQE
ncbi:ParM/StbA family protein [Paenibacillus sp. DLE-14]|uniref:ParM/StbA family protein n=1 Tax=Paenibacillus lignilyticus TaxID=1172615 RepID=A0ABS5CKA5_9BACL|nr:ParM/StbA family protein [Paenibacillus lignilyticus]MBP3966300.1 ParM/StbA family protein [Paenibacillus lignilyticus]